MTTDNTGIFFRTSQKKALEVLVYVANRRPGISPIELSYILFLAEQESLLDWGRPIFGDVYVLRSRVPVPQFIKELVEGNYLFSNIASDVSGSFVVKTEDKKIKIYAERKEDDQYFSVSDKETIDQFLIKNTETLKLLVESNETVIRSLDNIPISYEHFIPDSFESKEGMTKQLREFMYFGAFS